MSERIKFSDGVLRLASEAYGVYWNEDQQRGIHKLDEMLEQSALLSPAEQDYFRSTREIWSNAVDPNFLPADHSSANADFEVMYVKYRLLRKAGLYNEAMRWAWLTLQYGAAGTFRFLGAAATIVDLAASMKDIKMARHAAELFLSHYDLMQSATKYPFTPLGVSKPSAAQHDWTSEDANVSLYLPLQTAIECIAEDNSSCWERILIMELETSYEEGKQTPFASEIVAALESYYRQTGNIGGLEFLKAYEP